MIKNELDIIKENKNIAYILKEIAILIKNRKNNEYITASEGKKIDKLTIKLFKDITNIIFDIKDKSKIELVKEDIYLMRYDFIINDYEDEDESSVISEPVRELFDLIRKAKTKEEMQRYIQNSEKALDEIYI